MYISASTANPLPAMSEDLAADNKRLRATLKEWQDDYNTLLDDIEVVENMAREAVALLRAWAQDHEGDTVRAKTATFLQTVNLEQLQSEASAFIDWQGLEAVRDVQQKLGALREEHGTAERAVADTSAQRQRAQDELEALEAQIEASRQQLAAAEDDCGREKRALDDVRAEGAQARDTLSALQAECDDRDKLCRIKAEHLAEIKSSIQAELTRQFHLKAESKLLQEQIKAMRQTRGGVEGAICALTSQVLSAEDAAAESPVAADSVEPEADMSGSGGGEDAWHHLHKDVSKLQETLRCAETEVLALFDMASVDALD